MNKTKTPNKHSAVVLILGRPNVGKSTFVNNLLGTKVSITSPKSQTTRFSIKALYEDERGQLLFIDTPGIFKKAEDKLSRKINRRAQESIDGDFDVALYVVDHTRHRDYEEGKVLGIVRKIKKPVILIINKIDIKSPSYLSEYRFLEDEISEIYKISGLNRTHVKPLLDSLFEKAKRPYPLVDKDQFSYPALNVSSKIFIEELIREKVYLFTREEVPYKTAVRVLEVTERKNKTLYIKAVVLTLDKRYKKMLIGREGRMIKEIGMAARKELELSRGKKVYLDLSVDTDYHILD
ncbi:GTPase Era [Candidatus Roizmanbacteria bacterium RIFOXYB2_FULL_41_10]|uniref:GTPase Era n=1 Tax=Candidatus Roizmanbacteria bacterium RIFOXYA1_FULL_41_12 TaxID=1802082 RepID=A0A1F7K5R4_9BACT|nr:MAG: GTPase Era [Candidatus Roizmanbacteria bacterium RIFOXYA1_FULL_41_12]OGK71184.1 MAG: GTPase Era [Candidatus Roizmanbacteria bacterium RIFOXYC1_FULL_41_16]OGK72062.1 MAG: GTPase Era [Candidatus Roizmanbacteria bacterium RIFOXYB2_FULL_41_10]OGK72535.1 MAG: GTPase Era [Candidatus Roizmanbacteria bacterium RIFOXYC2_FULL_41_10]